jgi:hypothetical protein
MDEKRSSSEAPSVNVLLRDISDHLDVDIMFLIRLGWRFSSSMGWMAPDIQVCT